MSLCRRLRHSSNFGGFVSNPIRPHFHARARPPGTMTDKDRATNNANADADADADVSAEDREAWLRSRGVVIETPEDRRRAREEAERKERERAERAERGAEMRTLKYVKIPCDDSEPFEEMEVMVGVEEVGDALPALLKREFAGGGEVDAAKARAEAMRTLGEQGAGISTEALMRETEGGSTETFALVRPSDANGFCGVYLYLDEVGMLKGLPSNRRADRLAVECGFHGVNFYGDMFIGRVQTKPEPMRSVDFPLSDLDSSAKWMRMATMENVEYNKGLKELESAMARNGGMETIKMGGAPDASESMPTGQGDGYRWNQTEDEVEVSVDVPPGTTSKMVKVLFKSKQFIVKVNDEIVCDVSNLYANVRPDECTWTMGPDEVCVSLAKMNEDQIWRELSL